MPAASRRSREAFVAVAVIVLAGVCFWRSALQDFFAQDDFLILEANAAFHRLNESWGRALLLPGPVDNNFRPWSTIIFPGALQTLAGPDALIFHLVNLALHLWCSLACYFILRRITGNWGLATIAALWWLTRSLAFVPVHWVSGIQDLWYSAFATLLLWILVECGGRFKARQIILSGAVFFMALLSKETATVLFLCVPIWWLSTVGPSWRGRVGEPVRLQATLGVLLIAYFVWKTVATGGAATPYAFEIPSLGKVASYLAWSLEGSLGQPWWQVAVSVALVVILLAGLRPEQGRAPRDPASSDTEVPPAWRCGWIAASASVMSLPTAALAGRNPQYYAYFAGWLWTLVIFAAVHLGWGRHLVSRSPRNGKLLMGTLGLILVASAFHEHRLVQARNEVEWVSIPQGGANGPAAIVPNPEYLFSGGWLNTGTRLRVLNLEKDLMAMESGVNGARNSPIRKAPTIYLVGWTGDVFVGSRLRSGQNPRRLNSVSSAESMLRVFFNAPALKLRFILPVNHPGFSAIPAPYSMTPEDLARVLPWAPPETLFIFSSTWDGHLQRAFPLGTAGAGEAVRQVNEYIRTARLDPATWTNQ